MNKFNILKMSIVCTATLLSSCGKWLDITSKSEVSIDDMYSTAEGYYNSVTGVYINMGDLNLYGGKVSLSALEPLTAQYSISANNTDRTAWAAYDYQAKASKTIISDIWLTMYNNIFNCNLAIDKLRTEQRSLFEEGVHEIMLGEMLAMRAYMYFDLVRMFNPAYTVDPNANNVPYKTSWDSAIGERISSKKLLENLIADLSEAQSLLKGRDPILTGKANNDIYVSYDRTKRMNYYAVAALKARISLYMGDYENAYENAKIVIGSNKFRFITEEEIVNTDIYGAEQRANRVFTPELVFALDNDNVISTARGYYEGLSEDFLKSANCYEAGDVRRSAWLYSNPSANLKINMIKYKRSALATDSYKYPKACTPMLKLSEMYLIVEEAIMNVPSLDNSPLSYINTLKQNRKTSLVAEGSNDEVIATAIAREYICDFKGEGQLFFYYKRLNMNRIDNGMYNGNTVAVEEANFTFPRPDNENDLGN